MGLRRSKSLKRMLSRGESKRERAKEDDVPPLPSRQDFPQAVAATSSSLNRRPVKQAFVQFRVTSDDLVVPSATRKLVIPQRISSQRNTWPKSPREWRPGMYSFDSAPTLVKTPWEYDRSLRPGSQEHPRLQSRIFEQLPIEILECVLGQMRVVHSSGSGINFTNLQNDLRNLCLTDRRLAKVAHEHLYREIWMPQGAEPTKNKMTFSRPRSRLKLLLRTLQEVPVLADMVRHLRITASLVSQLDSEFRYLRIHSIHEIPVRYNSAVLRKLITCVPNLEYLTGYTLLAMKLTLPLFTALGSCHRLKSHTWHMGNAYWDDDVKFRIDPFIQCKANWPQLETLILWLEPGRQRGCSLSPGTVTAAVQRLPSLKHLMLKCLTPAEFHNGTLLMLPALKSLRLEELHGLTDQGIEQLAHSRLGLSLESLTLYDLELTSLRTVQNLFANLSRLRSFTLLQKTSPELQQWYSAISNNFSLASDTLRYLHWDVLAPGNGTAILANSIAAGKFPSLRTVKVPCDYDGAIQNLCRPIAREPITADDLATLEEWERFSGYRRSLRASQIQAQLRMRESRKQPSFNVIVEGEDHATEHHVIGSYLGNIASKIEYSLQPAVGAKSVFSSIATVDDVLWRRNPNAYEVLDTSEGQTVDLRYLF